LATDIARSNATRKGRCGENEGAALNIDGRPWRTIWRAADGGVEVIDQTALPHRLVVRRLRDSQAAVDAIRTMVVRGAPLIGATAAYGLALALDEDPSDAGLARAYDDLLAARPTAVNLRIALDDVRAVVTGLPPPRRAAAGWARADAFCEEDVALWPTRSADTASAR
jgi:methylthioribose-1-phosphate isomerase